MNSALPEGVDHEKLTLEQAIEIVKARAEIVGETGGKKTGKGGKKASPKKPKKTKEKAAEDSL